MRWDALRACHSTSRSFSPRFHPLWAGQKTGVDDIDRLTVAQKLCIPVVWAQVEAFSTPRLSDGIRRKLAVRELAT